VSQSRTPQAADLRASIDRDEAVERLRALVAIPSENPPGAEAEVAELVAKYCEELGLKVELHSAEEGRPSVIARWIGSSGPTLCYCSHIDVVPAGEAKLWEHEPFGAEIVDGIMYGRGTSDAKGPVTAALEAVSILKRVGWEPNGTLELALVADEETMGFKGAGYLVETGLIHPDLAIVGEPTTLRIVIAQRGAYWFRLTTRGLAAHGSAPERGVSAIRHMSEIVLQLDQKLPDIEHPIVGGPSLNVGTIRGGEKTNIVPASCTIEIDRRTIPGETEESVRTSIEDAIDRARERFPDLDATLDLDFKSNPFETDGEAPIVKAVSSALADLGREPELVGFRGASDARFLAEAGAEVLVWGPGDITLAHTARECVALDEVTDAAVAYAAAFARLLG
jgi:succinyl-diaminopimelate desuccinylase